MKEASRNTRGFTLLEILLVIGIMGVIAIFTIGISHSIRSMTKTNDTKGRIEQIAAKAREFYRAHESLPAPGTTTPGNSVPVGASDLNMEQKFRLDAWGQYLFYNRVPNAAITIDGNISIGAGTATYIRGVQVNGRRIAGVIISYGPNQAANYTTSGTNPIIYTLSTGSDDIIVPIDVSQEAVEISTEELKMLQNKVKAFDAVYEGIDNNGTGGTDEIGCTPVDDGSGTYTGVCPPTTGIGNDPNCGTATLDAVKAGRYSGCTAGTCTFQWSAVTNTAQTSDRANAFIYCLYALADTLTYDPWLNAYKWGCSDDATWGCGASGYATTNPRFHKFFSLGPDGLTGTTDSNGDGAIDDADDIIP